MGLDKINSLKKDMGLTNDDLASLSGIPKGTIDKITAGTTKDPKLGTLKALAKVLHCTLNDFDDKDSNSISPDKLNSDELSLLTDYRKLNDDGKEAARNAVYGFTMVPNYKKSDKSKILEENA